MKDRLCWRAFLVLLSGLICLLPMMSLGYRTFRWMQRPKQCIFLAILLFVVCGIILTGRSRSFARSGATGTKDGNMSTRWFDPDNLHRKTVDELEHVGFRTPNGSNGNTSTRWFDPDELLRKTIDELEHVGFQMPNGSIANRIMRLGGGFHPRQKEATVLKEDILATAERWKVVYVGCFYCRQNRPALSTVSVVTVQSSVRNCIKKCAQLGKAYASIFAGRMCRCGSGLSKGALGMFMGPQQCRMKCQEGSTQSCGDEGRASVYRIAKHENETLTMNRIRRTSAGCFAKPENFNANFKFHTMHPTLNVAECLIHCEKDNFVIAAWDASQVCLCGQFDIQFSLRQMGLPVNDSLCDSTCVEDSQTCSTKHVRIMRTYAKDDRCDDRNIISRSMGRRLVALISFPGSGNTWVRYLIEMATGIYSGSVYNDPDLYKNGFIGEFLPWNSRRTSVIKTHQFAEKYVAMFEEAIFIVRSPYDAIMAEFNRVRGGHVGYAEPELFRSMEWIYFIAYKMTKWIRSIQHYSVMEKILVIYFEDIVADPIQEVRKMVKFLGHPVTDIEQRLACLETNLSGNFKRPKRMLPFDAYSQKSKDTVNSYIKEARRIFESRNLPPLPNYER